MNLHKLLRSSRSSEETAAYKTFLPTADQLQQLADVGKDVLKCLPPEAGACALMSAVYADRLRISGLPAFVVAGTLGVAGQRVFGNGRPIDGGIFNSSNLDWDGHAWVMFGPYVADISIFRTAYSPRSPRLLTEHVRSEFGEGRGLYIDRWSDAPASGFHYSPQYVLKDSQIDALVRGSRAVFAPAGDCTP